MKETVQARCFTCHREEQWEVEDNTITSRTIQIEGGARAPDVHPQLAAWYILKSLREESIWRVVEPCAACEMPMAARQSRQVAFEWPLSIGKERYFVGPDLNTGPEGPIGNSELESRLKAEYEERFQVRSLVNPTHWFQASLFIIFIAIFLAWLSSAFCLSQFYLGIYDQGLGRP